MSILDTEMARRWAEDDMHKDTEGFSRSMDMLKNKHKIYYIMGKSATGKDTILQQLLLRLPLERIMMYTTRPMRSGERDGVTYNFVSDSAFRMMIAHRDVAEYRYYAVGRKDIWYYFTPRAELDTSKHSRIGIGTPESFNKLWREYGPKLIPIYIYADDTTRFLRAVEREYHETEPDWLELCRRYVADEQDFDEMSIGHIQNRFENNDLETCVQQICKFIEQGEDLC